MKKPILKSRPNGVVTMAVICLMFGCESAYYKTMETVGYHKRDIMVDRVQDARDAQKEAKDQFESALEKFSRVLGSIETDVARLIKEMEASIKEADSFISSMEKG
jgi:hypothetical protein